jgi:hypothetical protein
MTGERSKNHRYQTCYRRKISVREARSQDHNHRRTDHWRTSHKRTDHRRTDKCKKDYRKAEHTGRQMTAE